MIECDECVYWIFCERDGILLCKKHEESSNEENKDK